MSNLKRNLVEILTLIVLMNGVLFAFDSNNEPDWSLIDKSGLFQSPDNLVEGKN